MHTLTMPRLRYNAKECVWYCGAKYTCFNLLMPFGFDLLGKGVTREEAWADAMLFIGDETLVLMGLPRRDEVWK